MNKNPQPATPDYMPEPMPDPIPDPEPEVPSLPAPDPAVFHHDIPPTTDHQHPATHS